MQGQYVVIQPSLITSHDVEIDANATTTKQCVSIKTKLGSA